MARQVDFRKALKQIHVSGTVWIALCAAFLLTVALRQAGVRWWVVFSLSGFSGVVFFMLLSIYLFAFFRGVNRTQTAQEHPLTTSYAYLLFYDLCPFLGSLAGLASLLALPEVSGPEKLSALCEGALAMTFLVWIVLDPILGSSELMIPSSAAHRRRRLAQAQEQKKQRKAEREKLLREALEYEKINQAKWEKTFEPMAEELAILLSSLDPEDPEVRLYAAAQGARAWTLDGINGMKFLHQRVCSKLRERGRKAGWDRLAFWWDGIGGWRQPSAQNLFSS